MTSLNKIVQAWLHGSDKERAEARIALEAIIQPMLVGCLMGRGVTESHAEAVAAVVLSDCFLPGEESLLSRFDPKGKRLFANWLLQYTIRRFLNELYLENLLRQGGHDPALAEKGNPAQDPFAAMLRRIAVKALLEAFASCEPQAQVILLLTYAHNTKESQLAQAWGKSESELKKIISSNLSTLRGKTLSAVLRIDPSLPIIWDDVVAACADGATPLLLN